MSPGAYLERRFRADRCYQRGLGVEIGVAIVFSRKTVPCMVVELLQSLRSPLRSWPNACPEVPSLLPSRSTRDFGIEWHWLYVFDDLSVTRESMALLLNEFFHCGRKRFVTEKGPLTSVNPGQYPSTSSPEWFSYIIFLTELVERIWRKDQSIFL